MGNPPKILGWVPFLQFGTPSFFAARFQEGNIIGHAGGRGPVESLLKCYGVMDRSIKNGTRFPKGILLIFSPPGMGVPCARDATTRHARATDKQVFVSESTQARQTEPPNSPRPNRARCLALCWLIDSSRTPLGQTELVARNNPKDPYLMPIEIEALLPQ